MIRAARQANSKALLLQGHPARALRPGCPLTVCCNKPTDLLTNDLDQYPLAAATVELAVKNLLPGAKIEAALGDGHHHFPPHDLTFQVSIAVILTGAIVQITADRFMRCQISSQAS